MNLGSHYLTDLGFALVHAPKGKKAPVTDGWQTNPVRSVDEARRTWANGGNIGLHHGASGTCVLDVDNKGHAHVALAAVGIDLDELLSAPGAKVLSPKGPKPLYRQPEGIVLSRKALSWKTEDGKTVSIFELRGGAVQDLLPPSIHPSGQPYKWAPEPPQSREDIPKLPGSLLALWQNWDALKPTLAKASPWAPPPPARTYQGEGVSAITAFNQAHDVRDELERHGYLPKANERYLSPHSSTGIPGVCILKGEDGLERAYSHHVSDPLGSDHAHDAFSIYSILEFGGDTKAAVKGAAKELGMTLEASKRAAPKNKQRDTQPKKLAPLLTRMSDVEPQAVNWLWYPYLPFGKLTLLEGDPGQGKTFISLTLAAAITRGWPLLGQDGAPGKALEPGNVIYMSAEDGLADTLRPRLDAAGADVSRVHALTGWRQDDAGESVEGAVFLSDIPVLQDALEQVSPKLVVIDPLQAYLGSNVDMHRANETRPLLSAVGNLAEKYGCAVVIVRHFNKGSTKAIYAGAGSIDFTAAARSVLQVGERDGERLLAHAKSSLAPKGNTICYGFENDSFVWLGVADGVTADDLRQLTAPRRDDDSREGVLEDAVSFLQRFLVEGPQPAKVVEAEAKREGISSATLRRAKEKLGIISSRKSAPGSERGSGSWEWGLPTKVMKMPSPYAETGSVRDEHLEHLEEKHVRDEAVQDVSRRSQENDEHLEEVRQGRENVQDVQGAHARTLEVKDVQHLLGAREGEL